MANAPLFFFYFLSLLAPFSSASEYANHCNSVVPESPPTATFISLYSPTLSNGFFSGGGYLFRSKTRRSPSASFSFDFRSTRLHKTRSAGVLKVDATLTLRVYVELNNSTSRTPRLGGRIGNFTDVEEARLDLSGFWSESTGDLCMIGYGTFFGLRGDRLPLSAVLRLNYPTTSNISTSLLRATVESLSEIDGPSHFDPISLLGYVPANKYDFTMISQAKSSCSSPNQLGEDQSVSFDPSLVCGHILNVVRRRAFYLAGCSGRSCRTPARSFGFSTRFMSFQEVDCREEGKIRVLIQLSDSSEFAYDSPVVPGRSLVAEGYWDREKDQVCLIACRVLQDDSNARFPVGDCAVGLTLRFPVVFSLRNRSEVVGRMWSDKDKNDAGYFDTVSFQALGNEVYSIPGHRYEYTEIDLVKTSCTAAIRGSASSSLTFPDERASDDMSLHLRLRDGAGGFGWGTAKLFSVEDVFYGDDVIVKWAMAPAIMEAGLGSPPPPANNVGLIKNVSYSINYRWTSAASPIKRERIDIAAEGIYNAGTGALCMKGCRFPSSGRNSTDCKVLINIQLPALNTKVEENVNGSVIGRVNGCITSTRMKTDPLYFETISLRSRHIYRAEVAEVIERMDVEIAMVLISLTLSCVCIALQILHSKKHPAALLAVSVIMLAVLAAGYVIPLALNFDAVFVNQRRHYVNLQRGGWVEVDEVVVRVMSLAALFLTCRLLQAAWAVRSREEESGGGRRRPRDAEVTTLKLWLPLCFAGALLTWFIGEWPSRQSRPQGKELEGSSRWEALIPYAGFILDGFLLPQIVLNLHRGSKERVLTPFFYGGITAIRVLPHLYDAYRRHRFLHGDDSFKIYATRDGDLYSSAWDIVVPCECLLFAALIFLQQRFGGAFFVPWRVRMFMAYEEAPVEEPENCPH